MLQHRLAASISVLLIAFAVGGAEAVFAQAPMHVYLTWQGSTSSTMTVNAQTDATVDAVRVYYDTWARQGDENAYRYQAQGQAHRIDGLADGRWVHWIELTGLSPDSTYYFIVGSESSGFSTERAFRTVPADGRPLRFVTGGDLGVGEDVRRLLRHAADYSPYFALIGGDLAYVNGNLDAVGLWDDWLDAWGRLMVTPEGWTIPMVLAVGNHEVQGGYDGGPARAPFYMGFFAQPGRTSYFRQQFGASAVIYVLDTGHIVRHEAQVEWLKEQLERDTDIPYRFAVSLAKRIAVERDFSAPGVTRPVVLDGQFDDWDDLPYRFEVAAPVASTRANGTEPKTRRCASGSSTTLRSSISHSMSRTTTSYTSRARRSGTQAMKEQPRMPS